MLRLSAQIAALALPLAGGSAARAAVSGTGGSDNAGFLAILATPFVPAVIGLVLTTLFCMLIWRWLTRAWEPVMGQSVTRPAGLSAATLRWVRRGRFDSASLTAAILSLARKGAIDIEIQGKHVRLCKTAQPTRPLTIAEAIFADGFLRLYSSILLNSHATAALRRGAAALQDAIDSEWRTFQRQRLRRRFRLAYVIGALAVLATAALHQTPVWMLAGTLVTALSLVLAVRFAGFVRDHWRRLWWEPVWYAGGVVFHAIACLAALGFAWTVLSYQTGASEMQAMLCAALALAIPAIVHHWAAVGRFTAGPLRGRLEDMRNSLLSRTRGIDVVSMDQDRAPHEVPDFADWMPDALALDAVPTSKGEPVAKLQAAFEKPDRLAAVLRIAAVTLQTRAAIGTDEAPRVLETSGTG